MRGLMYVGNWREGYENEAEEYGASHRVPPRSLFRFSWGDQIFLARYENGITTVFGYFYLDRISMIYPEIYDIMRAGLHTAGRILSRNETDKFHDRSCGSYTIKEEMRIDMSVHDTVKGVIDIANTIGIKPATLIGGPFHKLDEPIKTDELKFTRNLRGYPFDEPKETRENVPKQAILKLSGYRQKGHEPMIAVPTQTSLLHPFLKRRHKD